MKCRILILIPGIAMTVWLASLINAQVPKSVSTSETLLEQAQDAEILGDGVGRWKLLNAVLKSSPDNREAHWLLGQIERDGSWMEYFDLPPLLASDKNLALYRQIRNNYPKTFRGQLELANWCRKHQLLDREQAHMLAALEVSNYPNDPKLRARLGQRLVNGDWRTQAEIDKLQQIQIENRQNLKAWTPAIEKLAARLNSRRDEIRDQAKAELKAITELAALPALENVLGNGDLESARLLVEFLGQFPSHHAADGLARLAVLSPWKVVRQEATEQLRSRSYPEYVPEMLASLRTPVSSKVRLVVGSGGVHLWEQFSSETQTAQQVFDKRSSKYIAPIVLPGNLQNNRTPEARQAARETNRFVNQIRLANESTTAVLQAQLKAQEAKAAVEVQNQETEEWNQRICEVLKDSTGIQLSTDPLAWWDWWLDYNQVTKEQKEYQYVFHGEVTLQRVALTRPPMSCLVAGTPIWTDRGAVPVESVEVGDLVLAKNPETGELNYQPVLRTTIRQEEPVLKVATPKGHIRATGGHNFWVSGRGWTKLRDIKVGQQFHGVAGPVEIQSLEEDGIEKTYNLIVADTHTYFVGEDLILSHDVTLAQPVDGVIPGDKRKHF